MRNPDDGHNHDASLRARAGRMAMRLRRAVGAGWCWLFGAQHHRVLGALHMIAGIISLAGFDPAVMKSCYLLIGLVYFLHHAR